MGGSAVLPATTTSIGASGFGYPGAAPSVPTSGSVLGTSTFPVSQPPAMQSAAPPVSSGSVLGTSAGFPAREAPQTMSGAAFASQPVPAAAPATSTMVGGYRASGAPFFPTGTDNSTWQAPPGSLKTSPDLRVSGHSTSVVAQSQSVPHPNPFAVGQGPVQASQTLQPGYMDAMDDPLHAATAPRTSVGSMAHVEREPEPQIAPECLVVVTRLLDVPAPHAASKATGMGKYVVKVYEEPEGGSGREKLLGESKPGKVENEEGGFGIVTFMGDEGKIAARTSGQMLKIKVYQDGLLGNTLLGECQIHRLDPRSAKTWPYALEKDDGEGAKCGIELNVAEVFRSAEAPPGQPMHSYSSQAFRTQTQTQMMHQKGQNPQMPAQKPMAPEHHAVVALFDVDKITDLAAPKDTKRARNAIEVSFWYETDPSELAAGVANTPLVTRAGPYQIEPEITNPRLRMAFMRESVGVKAPLFAGGASGDGSMYIRISVSYTSNRAGQEEEVTGTTDAIQVVWGGETPMRYFELRPPYSDTPVGGIHLKHKLVMEAEWENIKRMAQTDPHAGRRAAFTTEKRHGGSQANKSATSKIWDAMTGATVPKDEMKRLKCMLHNYEAQDRAMIQKLKKAELRMKEKPNTHTYMGAFRTWNSLEDMIRSIGPHPMAVSGLVGPQLCRGYEEHAYDDATSLRMRDFGYGSGAGPRRGRPNSARYYREIDKESRRVYEWKSRSVSAGRSGLSIRRNDGTERIGALDLDERVLRAAQAYSMPMASAALDDGARHTSKLRPLVCKPPEEMRMDKDNTWFSKTRLVPLRSLDDEDLETLRFASVPETQDISINFYDATPHYRASEDIWGDVIASRQPPSKYDNYRYQHAAPPSVRKRRVKDDCFMA